MHVMLVFSHVHSEKISTQEKFGKRKKRQPGYRRVHAGENWKSFSDNRLNYDDDFSILCRFLRADVETKFQPFLFKLLHRSAKNVKLHNLLFRCFSFLKRKLFSAVFQHSQSQKHFLIESDCATNAMQLRFDSRIQHTSRMQCQEDFRCRINAQIHLQIFTWATQLCTSPEYHSEDLSLPASQVHLHRPQLHRHEESFTYTQWWAIVHLYTAELRLSRTNNGTIEKVTWSSSRSQTIQW